MGTEVAEFCAQDIGVGIGRGAGILRAAAQIAKTVEIGVHRLINTLHLHCKNIAGFEFTTEIHQPVLYFIAVRQPVIENENGRSRPAIE